MHYLYASVSDAYRRLKVLKNSVADLESDTRKQIANLRKDTEQKHLDTHSQIVELHKEYSLATIMCVCVHI